MSTGAVLQVILSVYILLSVCRDVYSALLWGLKRFKSCSWPQCPCGMCVILSAMCRNLQHRVGMMLGTHFSVVSCSLSRCEVCLDHVEVGVDLCAGFLLISEVLNLLFDIQDLQQSFHRAMNKSRYTFPPQTWGRFLWSSLKQHIYWIWNHCLFCRILKHQDHDINV